VSPELFRFLRELADHNDRDWFAANKERYEREVRDPMLRFIEALAPRLKKISPHFVADAKPVGGSMMRIYRDTRFSKDKSPFKTAVMAHFEHKKGKEGSAPAFYLRVKPGESIAGGGIWHPEPPAIKKIRKAIVGDTKSWQKIREGRAFGSGCGMAGESLKRPPPGFPADHPFVDDLKRKDFAISAPLDERRLASAAFLDEVTAAFATSAPFLSFVTKAIGLPF
jgi:uncharacterized protein (TIGR02453 family)